MLNSKSHSHEAWHPRSTPTSGVGSGASQAGWSHWADPLILREALSVRKSNRDKVTRRGSFGRLSDA